MDSDSGKLFVGGIPWETTEDRLKDYFGAFGEIVDVVIMKDRLTGRARGFGFVAFADPSVADHVLQEKHSIDGRPVETKKAVPREEQQQGMPRGGGGGGGGVGGQQIRTKKIFVGGLASTVTEDDFRAYFEQFGNITDVVVMYDHSTQRHRGFGFITFDAEDSVDRVLHQTFHQLNEKTVEVKRAVPKDQSIPSGQGGGGPMGPFGGRGGGGYNGGGGSYGQPNFGGPRPPPPSGRGGGGGYPSYGYPPSGYGMGSGYPPAMNTGGGYGGMAPYGYGNVAPPMPGPRGPWATGGNNNNNNTGVGFSTGGSPANYGAPGGGGGYGGGGQSNVAGYGYGSADPSTPYGSAPTGYGAQAGGGGYGNSGIAPNPGYGGEAYGNYGDTSRGGGGALGGNYGSAPDGSNYGGGYSVAGKQTQRGGGPDARFRPYPSK